MKQYCEQGLSCSVGLISYCETQLDLLPNHASHSLRVHAVTWEYFFDSGEPLKTKTQLNITNTIMALLSQITI